MFWHGKFCSADCGNNALCGRVSYDITSNQPDIQKGHQSGLSSPSVGFNNSGNYTQATNGRQPSNCAVQSTNDVLSAARLQAIPYSQSRWDCLHCGPTLPIDNSAENIFLSASFSHRRTGCERLMPLTEFCEFYQPRWKMCGFARLFGHDWNSHPILPTRMSRHFSQIGWFIRCRSE